MKDTKIPQTLRDEMRRAAQCRVEKHQVVRPDSNPCPANRPSSNGREVSRQSYDLVSARLSERRQEVLRVLIDHGPATANQIGILLPPTKLCHRNIRSRLRELAGLGLAVPVSKVVDPVSGYPAMRYRALGPGEAPSRPADVGRPRGASRAELEATVARLEAAVASLKAENRALRSEHGAVEH